MENFVTEEGPFEAPDPVSGLMFARGTSDEDKTRLNEALYKHLEKHRIEVLKDFRTDEERNEDNTQLKLFQQDLYSKLHQFSNRIAGIGIGIHDKKLESYRDSGLVVMYQRTMEEDDVEEEEEQECKRFISEMPRYQCRRDGRFIPIYFFPTSIQLRNNVDTQGVK